MTKLSKRQINHLCHAGLDPASRKKENWIVQSSWAMTASLGGFLQIEPADKAHFDKGLKNRFKNGW
ncbi:MAG: hypothetical protein LLG40_08010 [Deltaproteobacteria bacterium]|nr:hypothetical protein [Deltaproteobacteria bacterium]